MSTRRHAALAVALLVFLAAAPRWCASARAQQPSRYPVDPQTMRALGAELLPAEESKNHPGRSTFPSISSKVASGTPPRTLAREHGFMSATFCPVNSWKGGGYPVEVKKEE